MYSCPKGHNSTEADFCSECGAKILGLGIVESPAPALVFKNTITIPCPDCRTPHEADSGNFCEICGYNFATGTGGGAAFPPPVINPGLNLPATAPNSPAKVGLTWQAIVSVDPRLAMPTSPPAPTRAPISIDLIHPTSLIGRTSIARAIHPEIPLDDDDAVSSRHAILTLLPDGSVILRDIGSSNGTIVNGQDIPIMADIPIRSGDEITLGHWTRIKILSN